MGISNVKTSRDLSSAIHYFGFSKAHNGHKERYVSSRFVNCTEQGCIQQTKAIREYFGKEKNVHGLTFVFSFAEDEIGLDDLDKQEMIMDSLRDVMHERFGNRQIGLFAQTDGSGQKFHIHAFVNSPDLTTGKLIDGRLKLHENAREMLSEAMSRANIEDLNKNVQTKQANKTNIAIVKAKEKNPNVYIWIEDMQNRIKSVLNDSSVTDVKKYEEALFSKGITVNVRKSKKTESGFACSYSFVDNDGKKRVARATKLGTDFQFESVQAFMRQHELDKQQREIEERKKQEEFDRKQRMSKREVRHEEMRQTVSKRSEIDSKPLVQKIDKSVPTNSQKPSEKLSEPLRAVSENKRVNNISENVKASRSENIASEPRSENSLLNYIKTFKFIMYSAEGTKFPKLGNVARTLEQHANLSVGKVLTDKQLLHFAETIPFKIPIFDELLNRYDARFSKAQTLSERFENQRSTNDLKQKADLAMNDIQTKSTDKDFGIER